MDFIKSLFIHYAQLLWLLLVLPFVFGLLLYMFSRGTRKLFADAKIPAVDIYLTGWIGVPLHELGHALFCIIFYHKITDIKLFKPDKDGTLGYVTHSYDSKNWYQAVGNFFIGCAPLIFGALMLYFVMILFFSGTFGTHSITQLVPLQKDSSFLSFVTAMWHFFKLSFLGFWQFIKHLNFSSWQFWVFAYITLAISSHMHLSLPDVRTMLRGLLILCVVLLLGMLAAEVWNFSAVAWLATSRIMNYLYALLLFAIGVSLVNWVFTFVITTLVRIVRGVAGK